MRHSLFASVIAVFLSVASAAQANDADTAPAAPVVAAVTLVNLNDADVETLDRELNGVGAAKAQAIVEYREANGPFASVDELLEVKGIGAAILDKNREKLSVE